MTLWHLMAGLISLLSVLYGGAGEWRYFGERTPGLKAVRFLPAVFKNEYDRRHWELHSALYFSPDGKTVYYQRQTRDEKGNYSKIMRTRRFKHGAWQAPETALKGFSLPAFDYQNQRMYISRVEPKEKLGSCYYTDFSNGKWGPLQALNNEFPIRLPSAAGSGNLYFYDTFPPDKGRGEIMMTQIRNGRCGVPLNLGPTVNSSGVEALPVVHPNERLLIFYSIGRGEENAGLYVSYKNQEERWGEAEFMGREINDGGLAFCGSFSPDGQYFFFLLRHSSSQPYKGEKREEGIYWIHSAYFLK